MFGSHMQETFAALDTLSWRSPCVGFVAMYGRGHRRDLGPARPSRLEATSFAPLCQQASPQLIFD